MATEITNSNMTDIGYFQAIITSEADAAPISGATVQILDINNPDNVLEEATTDGNGQSEMIELPTPPLEYSMAPSAIQPYAEYTVRITAPDFEPVDISGAEILSGETALQNTSLIPLDRQEPDTTELFVIPPHTLYGEYPPKIPEELVKEVDETGEVVLSRVVIPEYVVVHDGVPNDNSAKNYYVKYKDYIKNVASSEIYATWPEQTLFANILAIQSITLNRVYTEWYRYIVSFGILYSALHKKGHRLRCGAIAPHYFSSNFLSNNKGQAQQLAIAPPLHFEQFPIQ